MNKTLVLVMCDVLVLSAMSLSNGGFDRGTYSYTEQIDVTKELAAARGSAASAQKAAEEEKMRREQAEAAAANAQKDAQVAKRDAQAARAKADAETVRREQAEAAAANAQKDAQEAKQDAQAARAKADAETVLREQAEAVAANAQKDAWEAKQRELAAIEGESRAQSAAKQAGEIAALAQKELADTRMALKIALKTSDDYKNEITSAVCRVSVSLEDRNDALPSYYSPLIEHDGRVFVTAMCKKKELKKVKQIQVKVAGAEVVCEAPTVYCLGGDNRKLDIVFFELPGISATNRLSLGVANVGDYMFMISRKTGEVMNVQRIGSRIKPIVSAYLRLTPGDVCVDAKNRAIWYLCIPRLLGIGKNDHYFDGNEKLEEYHGE